MESKIQTQVDVDDDESVGKCMQDINADENVGKSMQEVPNTGQIGPIDNRSILIRSRKSGDGTEKDTDTGAALIATRSEVGFLVQDGGDRKEYRNPCTPVNGSPFPMFYLSTEPNSRIASHSKLHDDNIFLSITASDEAHAMAEDYTEEDPVLWAFPPPIVCLEHPPLNEEEVSPFLRFIRILLGNRLT